MIKNTWKCASNWIAQARDLFKDIKMERKNIHQRLTEKQYRAHLELDKFYSDFPEEDNFECDCEEDSLNFFSSGVFTNQEIAEILGVKKHTVKSLKRSALDKIAVGFCNLILQEE